MSDFTEHELAQIEAYAEHRAAEVMRMPDAQSVHLLGLRAVTEAGLQLFIAEKARVALDRDGCSHPFGKTEFPVPEPVRADLSAPDPFRPLPRMRMCLVCGEWWV
jgi:hypothetical protein